MSDATALHFIGKLLLSAREWTFLIGSGIVWSLSALILNILLYQNKLLPRWISAWGLVGATLSLIAYGLVFFHINLPEVFYLPIGVQEMVFAGWLIVKGLASDAKHNTKKNNRRDAEITEFFSEAGRLLSVRAVFVRLCDSDVRLKI